MYCATLLHLVSKLLRLLVIDRVGGITGREDDGWVGRWELGYTAGVGGRKAMALSGVMNDSFSVIGNQPAVQE
jgi:hypothetical protein